jgi:hypothetical protein
MSIKIFNGRKFKGNFEKFQLLAFSLHKNEEFLKLLSEKVNQKLTTVENDIKEGFIMVDSDKSVNIQRSFIKYLYKNIDNKQLNFKKNNPDNDFKSIYLNLYNSLNVNLLFQTIKGTIYCVIDAMDQDIIDYISKYFNLENFEYWDHVDKDPNCTDKEWHKRSLVWKSWDFETSFKIKIFNFEHEYNLLILAKKIIHTKF